MHSHAPWYKKQAQVFSFTPIVVRECFLFEVPINRKG